MPKLACAAQGCYTGAFFWHERTQPTYKAQPRLLFASKWHFKLGPSSPSGANVYVKGPLFAFTKGKKKIY